MRGAETAGGYYRDLGPKRRKTRSVYMFSGGLVPKRPGPKPRPLSHGSRERLGPTTHADTLHIERNDVYACLSQCERQRPSARSV